MQRWNVPVLVVFLCFLAAFQRTCLSKRPPSRISNGFAGPYRITLENFVDCNLPNIRTDIQVNFKCTEWKTDKECKHVSGNITFTRAFDDFPAINAMYPWRNNQWRKDAIIMKFNKGFAACNRYLSEPCSLILKNKTSFPKGAFLVDIPVKLSSPAFPVFPYGRWKSLMYGNQRYDTPVFCFGSIVNIVPK